MEVVHVGRLRKFMENWEVCRKDGQRPADRCPRFEWQVWIWPEEASRKAARELQRAWKRWQERTWWRAHVSVNSYILYPVECWTGVWQGDRFSRLGVPPAQVSVREQDVPNNFRLPSGLAYREMDPKLTLEWSDFQAAGVPPYIRPAVPKQDFCDGLGWDFGTFPVPGWRLVINGWVAFSTPNWPEPLNWRTHLDGYTRRLYQQALGHAYGRYYTEYWGDVLSRALAWVPAALWWQGLRPWENSGVVLQPVVKITPEDLSRYPDSLRERMKVIERVSTLDPRAVLYYGQPTLPFPTYRMGPLGEGNWQPPGIERLEHFKRWWEAGLPAHVIYEPERGGWATFFQAWNQWDWTWDRPVFYLASALETSCWWWNCTTYPVPVAYLRGWMVHWLPRVHYGWVTVPEGYGIPRVQGDPLAS